MRMTVVAEPHCVQTAGLIQCPVTHSRLETKDSSIKCTTSTLVCNVSDVFTESALREPVERLHALRLRSVSLSPLIFWANTYGLNTQKDFAPISNARS